MREEEAVAEIDLAQHWVGEEVVLVLGEGAPGHDVAVVLFHIALGLGLLVEDVGLHLVHHGLDLDVGLEVDEAVRVEVADADGPRPCWRSRSWSR